MTSGRFSYIFLAFLFIDTLLFVQMKVTSIWLLLPKERLGLDVDKHSLGQIHGIQGVVGVLLSLMVIYLIKKWKKKNYVRILCLVGAIGSLLTFCSYFLGFLYTSKTGIVYYMLVVKCMLTMFVLMLDTGSNIELAKVLPK